MSLFGRIIFFSFIMALCSGCASILSGTSQTISVNSNPAGANCKVLREGVVVGSVESTPGAITVQKTKHDLNVVCNKAGFSESTMFAESGSEGATLGNLILGGGIGWAVDSARGADNKYPDVITINMAGPEQGSSNP